MFRTSLLICSVPVVLSIIVTDPPPSDTDYKYSYNIEDPFTGDRKSQHEIRKDDVVSGAYSVVGPDGTKRTVEYTADSKHGFKAVVREETVTEHISLKQSGKDSQYYAEPRLLQKPVAYALEQATSPVLYSKKNHDIVFFSPANDIKTNRINFDHGRYFEPATK